MAVATSSLNFNPSNLPLSISSPLSIYFNQKPKYCWFFPAHSIHQQVLSALHAKYTLNLNLVSSSIICPCHHHLCLDTCKTFYPSKQCSKPPYAHYPIQQFQRFPTLISSMSLIFPLFALRKSQTSNLFRRKSFISHG